MPKIRLIEYQGRSQPIHVWAKELGLPKTTLFNRLAAGWATEKAFTHPVDTSLSAWRTTKSMTDVERELNETAFADLPPAFQKAVKEWGLKTHNYGSFLRKYQTKTFNKWFKENCATIPRA